MFAFLKKLFGGAKPESTGHPLDGATRAAEERAQAPYKVEPPPAPKPVEAAAPAPKPEKKQPEKKTPAKKPAAKPAPKTKRPSSRAKKAS